MKAIILLILVLLLSGCVGVEKEITLKTNGSQNGIHYTQTVTLSPDNTFILNETKVQYGQWHNTTISGVYKIKNGEYVLNYMFLGINSVIILTPKDNYYLDQDGGLWV